MLAFCFLTTRKYNTQVMEESTGKHNTRVILFTRWPIYCFVDHRSQNVIRAWLQAEKVPKTQVANFQAKIDAYERGGPELNPGLIVGPIAKNIYKMKIKGHKGHVQLRPMCCFGPKHDNEVTLLFGAIEKDFRLRPDNCREKANENRNAVLADPTRRRRERIDGTIKAGI